MLPALFWLVIITILSTRGGVQLPKFDLIGADKLGHAAAYCLLVWLILFGAARSGRTGFLWGLGAFLFATVYGIFMEFIQLNFFPGRFFEYDDMLANAIGALLGWAAFNWLARGRILHRITNR